MRYIFIDIFSTPFEYVISSYEYDSANLKFLYCRYSLRNPYEVFTECLRYTCEIILSIFFANYRLYIATGTPMRYIFVDTLFDNYRLYIAIETPMRYIFVDTFQQISIIYRHWNTYAIYSRRYPFRQISTAHRH